MFLDDASRARIAPYVSSLSDDVYALTGLPEEAIAVLFAHDGARHDDLRQTLARLLAEGALDGGPGVTPPAASGEARAFHEACIEGRGHAGVAEHAVIHLVLENVSILASRVVEDLRLGSFTEKSARHAALAAGSFVEPPGLSPSALATYRGIAERLCAAHRALLPRVVEALRARAPKAEGTTDAAHAAALHARAGELLRGFTPAGTRTSVALTANARALSTLLTKMLSHPLGEVVALAESMRRAALHVAPALMTQAAPNPYRQGLGRSVSEVLKRVYTPPAGGASSTIVLTQPVRLVRYDKDALERVALALAYEGSDPGAHAAGLIDGLRHASVRELTEIVNAAFAGRGPGDAAPRGLEASSMTFELMLDYGAYRDLQRHRLLSPATQRLTCHLGFETPAELVDLGLSEAFHEALLGAYQAWERLESEHPLEAQYAVPLAQRIRTLWTLNLRQLFHVVELRSAKHEHASCRRIAQGLYRTTGSVLPWLKELIRVDLESNAAVRG